eukprot:TRINITY_DN17983_c0_g1_i1.p1 TRINITY_DN17983_c0_g1~~TRINITY_DN17983_c0_g1_i1.p1  ORF type:complete len:548 (+),score=79.27 TRINITY_DN17983_c0_g1_i1:43-1686(+)
MSLLRPKYWSDDFFTTPSRKRGYGYPHHFCCILSECDHRHNEASYNSKDVFELIWVCLDEEHQVKEPPTEIIAAVRVLTDVIKDLEDTQVGQLLPALLCKETPLSVKSELMKVMTSTATRLLQSVEILMAVLYDSLTRRYLVKFAQAALLLLRSILLSKKFKTTSEPLGSLVAYFLTTFLRISNCKALNNTVANVLYPLLAKRHDLATVPFGIHVVSKCFQVNRIEGGSGGYRAFCNLCNIDPEMELVDIWREMVSANVSWCGDKSRDSLIRKSSKNEVLADAAVCVSQLGGTDGSHMPRFDTDQVTEGLHLFLNKTFQLQLQEAIPVIDTLHHCGDLSNSDGLAVLFMKWVAVLLREKHNVTLLCTIGIHKLLVAMLSNMITVKKVKGGNVHQDPNASHYPCFELLAQCEKLPLIEKYILGRDDVGDGVDEVVVPLESRHVILCITNMLTTMKSIHTTPSVKLTVAILHSSGLPVLLTHAKATRQLALLTSIDPSIFADFFASNDPSAMIALLQQNPKGVDEKTIIKALSSDPRAKQLLPNDLKPE